MIKQNEKSEKGNLIIFDYKPKVDGKDFEGNEGKKIQLVLGRDLFIMGFSCKPFSQESSLRFPGEHFFVLNSF